MGSSIHSPSSSSATPDTVTLQGKPTDAVSGEAIVGATIEIGLMSAITDANGHYSIGNVLANSDGGVSRDDQATITLTGVTSLVDMSNAAALQPADYHDFMIRGGFPDGGWRGGGTCAELDGEHPRKPTQSDSLHFNALQPLILQQEECQFAMSGYVKPSQLVPQKLASVNLSGQPRGLLKPNKIPGNFMAYP